VQHAYLDLAGAAHAGDLARVRQNEALLRAVLLDPSRVHPTREPLAVASAR
jgi:hypothetical protein